MMIIKAHHKCIHFMAALSASLIYIIIINIKIYILFLTVLLKWKITSVGGIVMQEAHHANPLWKHIHGGFYHVESIVHVC